MANIPEYASALSQAIQNTGIHNKLTGQTSRAISLSSSGSSGVPTSHAVGLGSPKLAIKSAPQSSSLSLPQKNKRQSIRNALQIEINSWYTQVQMGLIDYTLNSFEERFGKIEAHLRKRASHSLLDAAFFVVSIFTPSFVALVGLVKAARRAKLVGQAVQSLLSPRGLQNPTVSKNIRELGKIAEEKRKAAQKMLDAFPEFKSAKASLKKEATENTATLAVALGDIMSKEFSKSDSSTTPSLSKQNIGKLRRELNNQAYGLKLGFEKVADVAAWLATVKGFEHEQAIKIILKNIFPIEFLRDDGKHINEKTVSDNYAQRLDFALNFVEKDFGLKWKRGKYERCKFLFWIHAPGFIKKLGVGEGRPTNSLTICWGDVNWLKEFRDENGFIKSDLDWFAFMFQQKITPVRHRYHSLYRPIDEILLNQMFYAGIKKFVLKYPQNIPTLRRMYNLYGWNLLKVRMGHPGWYYTKWVIRQQRTTDIHGNILEPATPRNAFLYDNSF